MGGPLDTGGTSGEAAVGDGKGGEGMAGSSAADAGSSGANTPPGVVDRSKCVYHTEAPTEAVNPPTHDDAAAEAGASAGGGSGADSPNPASESSGGQGGAGDEPSITIQKNGFVGTYLADAEGKALYVYGADLPGDCESPPVTTCFDDCALAWPVFDAGARVVASGLDDAAFGTILRSDGLRQTTYLGWPLYYYKKDLLPGDAKGQGVGRIWHLAELVLPNVIVLRRGTTRLLADQYGRALYTSSADAPALADSPPSSACIDDCSQRFPPLSLPYVAPVTYLEPSDFGSFVRGDGRVQQTYKGLPLYRHAGDERAGDTHGAMLEGWSLVTP